MQHSALRIVISLELLFFSHDIRPFYNLKVPHFVRNVEFIGSQQYVTVHLLLSVGSTTILSMLAHLTSLQHPSGGRYVVHCLRDAPYLSGQHSVPRWKTQVLETEHFSSHSVALLLALRSWTSHLTSQSLNLLICTKAYHQGLPRWSSG